MYVNNCSVRHMLQDIDSRVLWKQRVGTNFPQQVGLGEVNFLVIMEVN